MPQIDYSIKSLSEYSSDELVTLQLALSIAWEKMKREQLANEDSTNAIAKKGEADQMTVLDTWGYRVRDAIKESQARESELPY